MGAELGLLEHRPDAARHRDLRGGAQHHDLRRRAARSRCASLRRARRARASRWSRATTGPGIADVELAMQDGYTTGQRARARAARHAPARRRVRARHRARRGHDGPAREVEPCLIAPTAGPRGSSAGVAERALAGRAALGRPRRAASATTAARSSRRSTGSGTATRRPTRPTRPAEVLAAHAGRGARRAARGAATARCARTRGAVMTLAWFDLERARGCAGPASATSRGGWCAPPRARACRPRAR